MVVSNSLMQSEVADKIRGRIFTLFDISWNIMKLLSLSLAGLRSDRFGVEIVYYIGGSLLAVAGILGLELFKNYQFKSLNQSVNENSRESSYFWRSKSRPYMF